MKKIKLLLISLISIFAFNINVFAASGSLSVSSESVYVGDNFTVTVNVSSAAAWNVHVLASGPVSGCAINQSDTTADAMDTNKTFSATCTATGEGTITISLSGDVTSASDGNAVSISSSRNVTVSKKTTPSNNNTNTNANNNNSNSNTRSNNTNTNTNTTKTTAKSSNNYLSSITIDDYTLNEEFNKETLEYSLSVLNNVDSININATLDDTSANVKGIGTVKLDNKENTFDIVVTAENGDTRTYVLKVTKLDALTVTIDKKEYTIVNDESEIELLDNYEKTTIKIDDTDVLAFYNKNTKCTLVVLKDSEDNTNYYIYDKGKYTLYKEYDFNGVRLYLLDNNDNTYIESEITIDNDKIKVYRLVNNKNNNTYALDEEEIEDYYLVYGIDVDTGYKGYYLIDSKLNSAVRYSDNLINLLNAYNSNNSNYKTYFFIIIGVCGLILIVTSIILILKKKKHY